MLTSFSNLFFSCMFSVLAKADKCYWSGMLWEKKKKVDETPPFLFWIMEKLTSPWIYRLGFPIFHTFIVLKEKTKKNLTRFPNFFCSLHASDDSILEEFYNVRIYLANDFTIYCHSVNPLESILPYN